MTVRTLVSTAVLAMTVALAAPAMAAGNPQTGATLVKQRCQMCHVLNKGQKPTLAPNLSGVVGRKAGSSDFAQYSPALKNANITWNAAKLDTFLTAPSKMVPGTKMVIALPNPADRADVIAFLVSDK
jgi:cytochrome c